MRESVPLMSVYTAVRFLTEDYRKRYVTIEALQGAFREHGRGFSAGLGTTANGLRVAKETQFLSVLGEPGAGKSTFLRRVGLEALVSKEFRVARRIRLRFTAARNIVAGLLSRWLPERPHWLRNTFLSPFLIRPTSRLEMCIPVYVELKTFRNREVNLSEILQQEFATCGFPDGFCARALTRGSLLVLLDGIDEIPSDRIDEAILHIREFVDQNDANRFIISCRTHFYHAWFPRFKDVILADFDDAQIEAFAQNWFRASAGEHGLGSQFIRALKGPAGAATRELAKTPLLLTFLCLVYEASQGIPANRSDLYEEALKILMTKWAADKRVRHEDIYVGMTPGLELLLLQRIAGEGFQRDKLFFSQQELFDAIAVFLREELNAPKHLDAERVLNAIQDDQGLFVERAHGILSFSHLTLQEYLAARYLLGSANRGDIVEKHLFSPHWREVFLLLAGMLEADPLLKQMAERCYKLVEINPSLSHMLGWAARVASEGVSGPEGAARRAICLAFVIAAVLASKQNRDIEARLDGGLLEKGRAGIAPKLAASRDTACSLSYRLDSSIDVDPRFLQTINLDHFHDVKDVYHVLTSGREHKLFKGEVIEKLRESLKGLIETVPERRRKGEPSVAYYNDVRARFFAAFHLFANNGSQLNELAPLEDYLYAISLIVDCRTSALSVTATGWENVCDALFLPNPDAI